MKKLFLLVLFCTIALYAAAQQQYVECIYLKNGSIIKGYIIEQIPNETVKILTRDGSIFVYNISDILKIAKEPKETNRAYQENEGLKVIGHNDLALNGIKLSNDERITLLGIAKANTFKSACHQINAGRVLLTLGIIMAGATAALIVAGSQQEYQADMDSYYNAAYGAAALADVGICLGCILKGIGKGRSNWVVRDYNMNNSSGLSDNTGSLKLSLSPSLIRTPNTQLGNQFALGAKLCLNF